MTWKVLVATGIATLEFSGLIAGSLITGNFARGQAPAPGWAARAAPVVLPVERPAPHGGDFTPPAPRGDLRGDIAANSKDSRRDREPPAEHRKPAPH